MNHNNARTKCPHSYDHVKTTTFNSHATYWKTCPHRVRGLCRNRYLPTHSLEIQLMLLHCIHFISCRFVQEDRWILLEWKLFARAGFLHLRSTDSAVVWQWISGYKQVSALRTELCFFYRPQNVQRGENSRKSYRGQSNLFWFVAGCSNTEILFTGGQRIPSSSHEQRDKTDRWRFARILEAGITASQRKRQVKIMKSYCPKRQFCKPLPTRHWSGIYTSKALKILRDTVAVTRL